MDRFEDLQADFAQLGFQGTFKRKRHLAVVFRPGAWGALCVIIWFLGREMSTWEVSKKQGREVEAEDTRTVLTSKSTQPLKFSPRFRQQTHAAVDFNSLVVSLVVQRQNVLGKIWQHFGTHAEPVQKVSN